VTLAKLERGDTEYLSAALIRRYTLYLSFTGGPTLRHLGQRYGARRAWPLYCAVDPQLYYPEPCAERWDLGYLGTYSPDRQPALETLLLEPARRWPRGRFVVAGPLYPSTLGWPANVQRIEHLHPGEHRAFYSAQRFTLNVTRADMVRAGYSPSIRLFEAAACATPIISDYWPGLETLFTPGQEILVADAPEEAVHYLRELPEADLVALGRRARCRVLAEHTAAHRAAELEAYVRDLQP
jgi:spore maturation protein CgeB